ncbi:MAG: bifunctional demethylmenaquinone methyltransferase/2-methoxy-6-polyprenyl-1,4-benzoquinol methylase UbiE [Ignavibacteriaceae bacterium]|nr:bifunctional demethylmenaquinone methyltransferase/2-methoxy-6-polyprenyl-1,4-benzoquinol methylase UbiE [Ignavibacteriaceae bacterium]
MQDKKTQVKQMFDAIAYRYDFLNHVLSAGVDVYWRKKALKLTKLNKDAVLLDVACGTGDFAIEAKKFGVENIFGADFSLNMLRLFNKKSDWIVGRDFQMVAEKLPLKVATVTNITVAFGVRNFYNIPEAFSSFHFALKEKGKVTVLEFSMPTSPLIKIFYQMYFKFILPVIGRIISKDKRAYTYLPDSVEEFDKSIDLVKLFYNAGFKTVKRYNLTFGLVQVVIAEK